MSQQSGVRVFGSGSRSFSILSLKLYARKEYSPETGSFEIDIFNTPRVDKPQKTVKKYDSLLLKSGGDDLMGAVIRDEFLHILAGEAGFTDYENAVPVTVYLNGEYYALMWLRESYCDKYFKKKYGDGAGEFVVLEGSETGKSAGNSSDSAEKKAIKDYNDIYYKYIKKDLTNDKNYNELCQYIDVENYLRYFAYNIYIGNNDWPQGNYKCYRYYAGEGEDYKDGTVFDGRWRYLLHDMDNGLGLYRTKGKLRYHYNDWANVMNPEHSRYAPLFAALMKRADCRNYFIEYTYSLMETVLSPENVTLRLEELHGLREKELPYYFEHLKYLRKTLKQTEGLTTESSLVSSYKSIITYATERPAYAKKYLESLR